MRSLIAATILCVFAMLSPANARQAADRADSIYTSSGYVTAAEYHGKARRLGSKAERRAWQRKGRYTVRAAKRRAVRGAVIAEKKFAPLSSRTFLGYAEELAQPKGSVSVAGLPDR